MDTRRDFYKKVSTAAVIEFYGRRAIGPTCIGQDLERCYPIANGSERWEKVTTFCLDGYHLGLMEHSGDAWQMIEKISAELN